MRRWWALALVALGWGLCSSQGQWTTQTIQLKPGWNAVFLEVDPAPEDCDSLFAGLPVESVWDWNARTDSAQFVQDPATLLPGASGWLTWFPPAHPLASQTSLFILRDGRGYLIKLANNAPAVAWTVTGRPSLREVTWQAGALNFTGSTLQRKRPPSPACSRGRRVWLGNRSID